MTLDRLDWHLSNWSQWMKSSDTNRLGYPKKSLMIASGGGSSDDEFEAMCDEVDIQCAMAIDSIIDSITLPQRTAINHHWLQVSHHYPTQELDYDEALENIIRLTNKRGLQ
jgi:hypothetical protein